MSGSNNLERHKYNFYADTSQGHVWQRILKVNDTYYCKTTHITEHSVTITNSKIKP